MAQPTNTFSSYDAKGNREDLSNVIYRVDPTETPFMSGVEKVKATGVTHEWQTQALAAASNANFVIEGDEATNDAATATVRLANVTAISDKVAVVTGTQQAVKKAGRTDEMDYQKVLKGLELRRDMEKILLDNNAKVAGDDSTAREPAGVEAWIKTNVDKASNGSNPTGDGTDARTDGTARAFLESQLGSVLQQCYTSGGKPDTIMVGAFNKRTFSSFTGRATPTEDTGKKRIVAAVNVYESDFGTLDVVANRFSRAGSALVLQMDMWAVAYLRNMDSYPLAKTGDTEKAQILCEYTLEARNEKSSGIVADLTTS